MSDNTNKTCDGFKNETSNDSNKIKIKPKKKKPPLRQRRNSDEDDEEDAETTL